MNKKKTMLKKPRTKSAARGLSQDPSQTAKAAVENAEGLLAKASQSQLESKQGHVQWKPGSIRIRPSGAYSSARGNISRPRQMLWTGELRDLPYDLVGNQTVIVPADAVAFFEGSTHGNGCLAPQRHDAPRACGTSQGAGAVLEEVERGRVSLEASEDPVAKETRDGHEERTRIVCHLPLNDADEHKRGRSLYLPRRTPDAGTGREGLYP